VLVVVGSGDWVCRAWRVVRGGTRNVETVIERVAACLCLEAAAGDAGGGLLRLGQFLRRQRRPKVPLVLPITDVAPASSARTRWISRRTWRVVSPSITRASRCHRALPVALRITVIRFNSFTLIRTVSSLTMMPSQ
jgi:hypothetical protein